MCTESNRRLHCKQEKRTRLRGCGDFARRSVIKLMLPAPTSFSEKKRNNEKNAIFSANLELRSVTIVEVKLGIA